MVEPVTDSRQQNEEVEQTSQLDQQQKQNLVILDNEQIPAESLPEMELDHTPLQIDNQKLTDDVELRINIQNEINGANATTENVNSTRKCSSSSNSSNKSGGPPGSGLHNGKLQANRQQNTCYGRELWDCLPVLEKNTKIRTIQMENVKDLFSALRKGLDNFSAHINHSSQIYQRKT